MSGACAEDWLYGKELKPFSREGAHRGWTDGDCRIMYSAGALRSSQHLWFSLAGSDPPAAVPHPDVPCREVQVFPDQGESPVRCQVVATLGGSPGNELVSERFCQELNYWTTSFQCPGCGKAWDSIMCLRSRGRGKNESVEDKQTTQPLCYSHLHNLGLFIRTIKCVIHWNSAFHYSMVSPKRVKYHSRDYLGINITLNSI